MSEQTITPDKVKPSDFTTDLKDDFVAVDSEGNVVARSSNKQGAERAAPQAAAYFTGSDFKVDKESDNKQIKSKLDTSDVSGSGAAAQEALAQAPAHTFEETLAHVDKGKDNEKSKESNRKAADKIVAQRKEQKEKQAEENAADLEARGDNPSTLVDKPEDKAEDTDGRFDKPDLTKASSPSLSAENTKTTSKTVAESGDESAKAAAEKAKP